MQLLEDASSLCIAPHEIDESASYSAFFIYTICMKKRERHTAMPSAPGRLMGAGFHRESHYNAGANHRLAGILIVIIMLLTAPSGLIAFSYCEEPCETPGAYSCRPEGGEFHYICVNNPDGDGLVWCPLFCETFYTGRVCKDGRCDCICEPGQTRCNSETAMSDCVLVSSSTGCGNWSIDFPCASGRCEGERCVDDETGGASQLKCGITPDFWLLQTLLIAALTLIRAVKREARLTAR